MPAQKVALVTGGMSGLWEAIAIRLHADGVQVVVTHSEHNDHIEHQQQASRQFLAFPVDVADFDSC